MRTPGSGHKTRAAKDLTDALAGLVERVAGLEEAVGRLSTVAGRTTAKEWYTTGDLAAALGVSQYTVQARWCAEGRIECEKAPLTNKWRIPAKEYERLVRGGSLRVRKKR
jgi:hypothetical protein